MSLAVHVTKTISSQHHANALFYEKEQGPNKFHRSNQRFITQKETENLQS